MSQIGIYGLGGFAREVFNYNKIKLNNICFVTDLKDENFQKWKNNKNICFWEDFKKDEKNKIILAISDPKIRKLLYQNIKNNSKISFLESISDKSLIFEDVKIGECAIICPFTTFTTNIKIGIGFQANIYSYIGHDCMIGYFVTFAPAVKCNGNVTVEDNVYIGTGAIIKQGKLNNPLVIGKNSKISAGAYVNKNVPPDHIAYGNPCKFIKIK